MRSFARVRRRGGAKRLAGLAAFVAAGLAMAAPAFSVAPGTEPPGQDANCKRGEVTILGTANADTLVGTPERDVIRGDAGADTIRGLGGDDELCGNQTGDTILGGSGDDAINGGKGGDDVRGAADNDRVNGARSGDLVRGGGDADFVRGGRSGNDACDGGAGTDRTDDPTTCEQLTSVP